jgi:hypothetical protein
MRRLLVTAVVLVALGFGAEMAYAYITSPGSGSGVAATQSLGAVTIDAAVATPTTALLPGASGDATFEIDNSNATALTLTTVTETGPISVSNAPGCSAGNDGVSFTNQSALTVTVPAHASGFVIDLPASVSLSADSASACQGATFSIPINATVQLG